MKHLAILSFALLCTGSPAARRAATVPPGSSDPAGQAAIRYEHCEPLADSDPLRPGSRPAVIDTGKEKTGALRCNHLCDEAGEKIRHLPIVDALNRTAGKGREFVQAYRSGSKRITLRSAPPGDSRMIGTIFEGEEIKHLSEI